MRKLPTMIASGLMSIAALLLTTTPALAEHRNVDFSISFGSPGYAPPPAVYGPPQALYSAPPAVYAGAQPGYPADVYAYRQREWQERQWRRQWRERRWEQHRREHEWRERQWRERQWGGHRGYGRDD